MMEADPEAYSESDAESVVEAELVEDRDAAEEAVQRSSAVSYGSLVATGMAMSIQTVLTPLQTSSKADMAALVLAPQRPLICDLTLGASGPHTVGRSAGASSVLNVC